MKDCCPITRTHTRMRTHRAVEDIERDRYVTELFKFGDMNKIDKQVY